MKILHISPHLGGGVGKALSSLVTGSIGLNCIHSFVLLEKPEKTQFYDKIRDYGCNIYVRPDINQIFQLITSSDIVQLEWWNHPATYQFLSETVFPPMRLIIWCHQSGLYPPYIPERLLTIAEKFVFTSSCSLQASYISKIYRREKDRFSVISSGMGLNTPNCMRSVPFLPLKACYMGTLNFSKLHPDFVDFLNKVKTPNFAIKVIGDDVNRELLINQCVAMHKPHLLEFTGFLPDITQSLTSSDIFIYLLNPVHYGTAENALLEAMSAGVVPIVLNNPCEMAIVEDGETGYIVDSPDEFSAVVSYLSDNLDEWLRMSRNAAFYVASSYSAEIMAKEMDTEYRLVMEHDKGEYRFLNIFGRKPLDWYLASHINENETIDEGKKRFLQYGIHENTKGGINHFLTYFPYDDELKRYSMKY